MMNNLLNISLLSATLLSISACDSTKPLELIYHDREKLILPSEYDEDKHIFLCVKGETDDETKKRANKANSHYSSQLKIIIEDFSDGFLSQFKEKAKSDTNNDTEGSDFSIMDGLKAGLELQERSEKLGAEIEKKYQCMLIDTIESD